MSSTTATVASGVNHPDPGTAAPDLDAIRTDLHTYTAIMREPDVPFRAADAAAHRLAAHLPALLAEVARLRALVVQLTDDADDYRLIADAVAGTLIGDGWDDDAAEVAIVIAWAQHMAAVHPDCPGRHCTAATTASNTGAGNG